MDKRFYTLPSEYGGICMIKIYTRNSKPVTEVRLKDYRPLNDGEVFKLCRKSNEGLSVIGVIEKDKGIFDGEYNADELSVVRKNVESGTIAEEFFIPQPEVHKEETKPSLPEEFTFDNFFGGGFEWRRIGGYYSICEYSVVSHILSEIYDTINKTGHYYIGMYETEEAKYIAIAAAGKSNPFGRLAKYTYKLSGGGRRYYVVCAGIDETGEYFITDD